MLFKPTGKDFTAIAYYTGKIINLFGLLMFVPLLTALFMREWNAIFMFAIPISVCILFWLATDRFFYTERDLNWAQGMMIVSLSWFLAMLIGAIPYYLSGFWGSYLDACFDVMSGLTTTGLTLVQDLDHLPYSMNMWRHVLTFLGGQGMIVLAITFLVRATGGAIKIYIGEAKEERLLPSVISTARAVWLISSIYLVAGTLVFLMVNLFIGMKPLRAFLHAFWINMSAWSTGGFAPMSLNIFYYHSMLLEIVAVTFFTIGSFNFALHWAVWNGDRKEIFRNIELISFAITTMAVFFFTTAVLLQSGVYTDVVSAARKIYFQVASAHSGTGFMTITSGQLPSQWKEFAMFGLVLAMALGGSACSTAGGFKALRIGLIFKGITSEVKRLLAPESSVTVSYFHHIKNNVLNDNQVKMAGIVILAYLFIYIFGALLGMLYGYPLINALFDSTSAGANVGLSCGVTSPSMPGPMKAYYILSMWMGRLEFVSIFALVGFFAAMVKGRK